MFCSLRTHSHFSFLRGASSPQVLAETAAALGHTAVALTDINGVYGAVDHERACRTAGITPIIGAEIMLCGVPVSVLAKNAEGYAELCKLLSDTERTSVAAHHVFCIVHATDVAECDVRNVLRVLPRHDTFLGVSHSGLPAARRAANAVRTLGATLGVPCVVANDVWYATKEHAATHDLLTCIRLGITVFDAHPERLRNNRARLYAKEHLQHLLPWPELFDAAEYIESNCSYSLLTGMVTPPAARIPDGRAAEDVLAEECMRALPLRYAAHNTRAAAQLTHELHVIADLGLADFFLVVKEVVDEAKRRGIRCSGRGSAANSIVAYLLGITGVCPLQHNLLFERFLHRGRKGTPDIDVDFDSDRRSEIISWMEQRFGKDQTAMTATRITYRMRMAVRDAAKALGWPMDTVRAMAKVIPGYTSKDALHYRADLATVCGDVPMLDVLLRAVEMLMDIPRHLGQHSGGMILAERSLSCFTPVQRSANGVTVVQFDKDDVEAMGLVKFDVLGLRMLACISEATEHIAQYCSSPPNIDELPLDDAETFRLIRSGNTLGVFQIESQGQMHLLAKHQPQTFNDLVTEVALFRPGPLQGGMVHPYIARRNGLQPVEYLHPDVEPILRDTLGIVLYQEQVLEIAHRFAGMTLEQADTFRALVSKNRNPQLMENMRCVFVQGATRRGVPLDVAQAMYETVSHFVGYGFCRSHAAAFAKIVYQSAWLKTHHPAAFMAAFMQHRPGMYNLTTLEEECKRFGVEVLQPCILRSGVRYALEHTATGKRGIRKPLTAITGLSAECAAEIVLERAARQFANVEDVVQRCTTIDANVADALAMSGALHALERSERRAAWIAGVALRRRRTTAVTLLDVPCVHSSEIPALQPLTAPERLSYDYATQGAARFHPITLYRRILHSLEIRSVEVVKRLPADGRTSITTAGIVILRQAPPTAHGVLFITLEDETGFLQCIVREPLRERFRTELRSSALILRGTVHGTANWRGLLVSDVRMLSHVHTVTATHSSVGEYGSTGITGITELPELRNYLNYLNYGIT